MVTHVFNLLYPRFFFPNISKNHNDAGKNAFHCFDGGSQVWDSYNVSPSIDQARVAHGLGFFFFLQHFLHWIYPIFRITTLIEEKHFFKMLAHDLFLAPASDFLCHQIHTLDDAFFVGGYHAVANRL